MRRRPNEAVGEPFISAAECMAIYKDKGTAEKNCSFWDVDKDGTITEEEYVQQALSMGKKK